jgi:predicted short-subunit dehydrogenase-like oxidoreductase (DUF2520 family)
MPKGRRVERPRRGPRVAIVGAGIVGTVLGRVLVEEGGEVVAIVSRTLASARKAGRFLRCRRVSTTLTDIPPSAEIVYLTVPHAAIENVARALADQPGLDFGRLAVCHASGMLTADALSPLARRGTTTFSFHPLQTFPRTFAPRMIVPSARGIFYGVDGSARGLRIARRFARALAGRTVIIPRDTRVLYHAACVVASNHLTTLMAVLREMFEALGSSEREFFRVFAPIVEATLENIRRTSPADALSGPVARGGLETVAAHFDAVEVAVPHLIPYFRAVSLETVRLARAKGSIDAAQEAALRRLIASRQLEESPSMESL